jgi:hypothetical protein
MSITKKAAIALATALITTGLAAPSFAATAAVRSVNHVAVQSIPVDPACLLFGICPPRK